LFRSKYWLLLSVIARVKLHVIIPFAWVTLVL